MSFTRIMKATVLKGLSRGILGLAAGATGGAILKEDVLDTMTTGALIGGINGTLEGFFDQLAMETNNPTASAFSNLISVAGFATPALAWFILKSAKETGLSVGLTFGTYWLGNSIIFGGSMLLACCTCCAASGPLRLATHLAFPESVANKLDVQLQSLAPVSGQQRQAVNQHGFFADFGSREANANHEPDQLHVNSYQV